MDSSKDHFPVPPGHQPFNLSLHILRLPASDPASGIGDNAVAAELVAAVLHLDKGPGVIGDFSEVKRLVFPCLSYVNNVLRSPVLCKILV